MKKKVRDKKKMGEIVSKHCCCCERKKEPTTEEILQEEREKQEEERRSPGEALPDPLKLQRSDDSIIINGFLFQRRYM